MDAQCARYAGCTLGKITDTYGC